jgi:prophage tail gpP-like protein
MSQAVTQLPEVEVSASRLTDATGLVLRIEGTDYGGWTSVRVRRSIEEASSPWACEVSERWPGQDKPWPISPGQKCEVILDGMLVNTGWVDAYTVAFDARSHRVEARGRSLTEDAVDSSVEIDAGQLQGLTFQQIAERVMKPLGIKVVYDAPAGEKLPDVQIQQGETRHAFLERLSRLLGVLVSDDERGNLVVTRPGAHGASGKLVQGQNILAASAEFDWSDRGSSYTVKAHNKNTDDAADWDPDSGDGGDSGEGGDGGGGEPDTLVAPSATVTDPAVKRNRPVIIYGEHVMDAAQAKQRAEYEKARRIGRSKRARVTVQGWTQPDGTLWHAGDTVPIDAKFLGLNESLVIASVEFVKDDGGTRTDLELTLPGAFLATEQEIDRASKPASGDAKDTKQAWDEGAAGNGSAGDDEP